VEKYLLIPKDALIREDKKNGYVYTVTKNDRIYKRSIVYKDFDDKSIIVRDGLKDGDTVLDNPIMNLIDGVRIKRSKS